MFLAIVHVHVCFYLCLFFYLLFLYTVPIMWTLVHWTDWGYTSRGEMPPGSLLTLPAPSLPHQPYMVSTTNYIVTSVVAVCLCLWYGRVIHYDRVY